MFRLTCPAEGDSVANKKGLFCALRSLYSMDPSEDGRTVRPMGLKPFRQARSSNGRVHRFENQLFGRRCSCHFSPFAQLGTIESPVESE